MKLSRLLLAAAPAAFAFAAAPAAATVSINSIAFDSFGGRTGTILPSPNGSGSATVGIGRIRLTGVDNATNLAVSFITYCIDVMNWLHTGVFTESFASAGSNGLTEVKLNRLNAIITKSASMVSSADTSAAFQLAIWEVMFETGPSYNVNSGVFSVSGGDSGTAAGLANGYLTNVTNGAWLPAPTTGLKVLTATTGTNQTQMFAVQVPAPPLNATVPEPATWGMMLLGFGVVGFAARRRRTRIVAA